MSLLYRCEVSRSPRQWRRGHSTRRDYALVCSSKDGSDLKSEQTRILLVLRVAQIEPSHWPSVLRSRANTQVAARRPPNSPWQKWVRRLCTHFRWGQTLALSVLWL